MKNIIQLYFENNKAVPFIIRREHWANNYGMIITSVNPKKTSNGWYGDVWGYPLPPLDNSSGNSYWGTTGKIEKIKNSGSYQWKRVEDIPEIWKKYMKQELEQSSRYISATQWSSTQK